MNENGPVLTRSLLTDHIQNHGLCPGANSLEEWANQDSITFRFGGDRAIRLPLGRFKRGLTAHDTHHVLTGYGTDIRGEVELASWELASGGCSRHLAYWLDRIALFPVGLFLHPLASLRALRRGWGSRNLYSMEPEEILDAEIDVLRRRMRI